MSTLLQRIAAVQQALAPPQSSPASHITLVPTAPRQPLDDISQQSPQSVGQAQTGRPNLNVPVNGENLDEQLTQLASASNGGSISVDGQNYPQAPGGTDLSQALGSVYQQLQPAAKAHMLTQKMVQDAVGQTVTDVTKDQLGVSRAGRDVQALMQQRANGTLSDQAYEAAIAQAKNGQAGYSFDQLVRAPGGAQLLGVQDQIQQAREQTLQNYAKSNGWDRSEVKWDDKQNGPTPDYQTADFNFRRAQQKDTEAKARHYPDKIKADQRQAAIDNLSKLQTHGFAQLGQLQKAKAEGQGDEQTDLQITNLKNSLQMWGGQQSKLIGDDGMGNMAAAPQPAQAPAAPQPAQGRPPIVVNSQDELRSGLAAKKWPHGTIVQLGSEQGVVTGDPAAPLGRVQ